MCTRYCTGGKKDKEESRSMMLYETSFGIFSWARSLICGHIGKYYYDEIHGTVYLSTVGKSDQFHCLCILHWIWMPSSNCAEHFRSKMTLQSQMLPPYNSNILPTGLCSHRASILKSWISGSLWHFVSQHTEHRDAKAANKYSGNSLALWLYAWLIPPPRCLEKSSLMLLASLVILELC